jgi:DHA1 family bicyclomycin/chloramphenicol resistance-like MFS transporter
LGAAASAVVTVAMIRDLFGGYRLVRMLARIGLIGGLAPIVAPVIGSQLLLVVSWRGVFAALAAYGLVILILCVLAIPETLPGRSERAPENATSLSRLRAVLRDPVFVGTAIVGSMIFASVITYLSTSPFVFQSNLGLNPQGFGALFAVNAAGLLIAAQASARLMRFLEPAWLLASALAVLLVSGSALVILDRSHAGFLGIAVASFVFVSTTGFANPCVGVLSLKDHRGRAGTAAAITGFTNSVIGGLISPLPGLLGGGAAFSLGIVVSASMVVALLALFLVVRPWHVAALDRS